MSTKYLLYLFLATIYLANSPLLLGAKQESQRFNTTVKAVTKVMPSVVNIATKTRVQRVGYLYDWWRDNWTPYSQELPPQESAGSGVIVSQFGHILTNVHVVRDADEIWVKLTDEDGNHQVYKARAVAGSISTDIALLKIIPEKDGQIFPAAEFAQEDDLLLGETVMALGNPFGLGGSVSKGILSSKSRRTTNIGEKLEIPDWLQTDASINPGNSGGPLINIDGQIIGINVAVLKEGQGIGFAIPIKRVNESLSRFFTPEFLDDNWFGATINPNTNPPEITEVEPGSPADNAGLEAADQIIELNRKKMDSFIDIASSLVGLGKKRDVLIKYIRNNERREVSVKLIPEIAVFNSGLIRQKTGAILKKITPELADALNFDTVDGFVISQVDDGTPARKAKLQPGLIITTVDGKKHDDIIDLARFLHNKKTGDQVTLNIIQIRQRGLFVRRSIGKLSLTLL